MLNLLFIYATVVIFSLPLLSTHQLFLTEQQLVLNFSTKSSIVHAYIITPLLTYSFVSFFLLSKTLPKSYNHIFSNNGIFMRIFSSLIKVTCPYYVTHTF